MDLALRSVEDILLIAGVDGRITFANPRAVAVLDSSEQSLRGRDLLEVLAEAEQSSPESHRESLVRLVVDRAKIEREIIIPAVHPRHFMLRMAAVRSGEDGPGSVLGIVASLSDITRQHELQQTKNDVMALVSHEMRTPLTAIQGMSELLAQFDFDPERAREMSVAIHDEAKRLTRMISQYLDITRLEAGATVLRRSAGAGRSSCGADLADAGSIGRRTGHPIDTKPGFRCQPGACRRGPAFQRGKQPRVKRDQIQPEKIRKWSFRRRTPRMVFQLKSPTKATVYRRTA